MVALAFVLIGAALMTFVCNIYFTRQAWDLSATVRNGVLTFGPCDAPPIRWDGSDRKDVWARMKDDGIVVGSHNAPVVNVPFLVGPAPARRVLLWPVLLIPLGFELSAWRRVPRGVCPTCGYEVGSLARCPECGSANRRTADRDGR